MNTKLIGDLIGLRYKLMWAKTRTRNGKIALFMTGYLLLVLVIAVLAAGGFGAAVIAVRAGKALLVTRVVLTSLSAQALLATVMLGFGMSAIFSDFELRRFPIGASDRRLVRHLIGIIDPFWILTLALDLGLVIGLYVLGAGNFWSGLIAVLLLTVCNYLLARIIEMVIDRLMQRPSGSTIVMVGVVCLSLSGAVIPPLVKRFPAVVPAMLSFLSVTPPFGAASALAQSGAAVLSGFAIELVWLAGLIGALIALEKRPLQRHTAATTAMSFESRYDRVAAALGFDNAPLVGWWLRFYARNSRFKAMLLISLPLVAFLTFNMGSRGKGPGYFVVALGAFPIITFLATARFMVNQFGYLGGGYRRCFLLPIEPAAVLRTGSYASLLLSAGFIPLGLLGWAILAPVPFDARQLFMLLATGTTGLFVFHALGLWATLYGPRRGNYNQSLGNDLSLMGNIIIIGGVMCCLFGTQILFKTSPAIFDVAHWWVWIVAPVAGLALYSFSLRATSGLLRGKREQLMAIVEGRA
jgi:hypothetical protein